MKILLELFNGYSENDIHIRRISHSPPSHVRKISYFLAWNYQDKNLQGFCADSSLSFPVSISRNIMMPQLQYINQR